MADSTGAYTTSYLSSAQAVLQSGRLLKGLIDADAPTRDFAVTQLERAAQRHQTGGDSYRQLMFSETVGKPAEFAERATEDVLATIMTDVNIANMLMALGQNVGELGPQKNPQLLDEAVSAAGRSTRIVEGALATSAGGVGRFGFTETKPAKLSPSVDLAAAIQNYSTTAEATLKELIDSSKDAVMTIINALARLDPNRVLEALASVGGLMGELPKVGRLFRQGVELFKSAVSSLTSLFGTEFIAKMKEQVGKIWEKLKGGEYLAAPIAWSFGADGLKEEIEAKLKLEGLQLASLDEGSQALAALGVSFKDKIGMLAGVASAVAVAGTLLFLVPGIGSQLTLISASIYALVLAGIVLIGRDYTDIGPFDRVNGIRKITISVSG